MNIFHGRDLAGTTIGGGQRPNLVGDPLSGVNRSRDNIVNGGAWYNVGAYALPERGHFGNLGRNTMITPGDWNLDLGLFKNFDVTEQVKLQYRWEMFNAMNHANLTNPVGRIISGTAGEINTLTGPRIMQMGLRDRVLAAGSVRLATEPAVRRWTPPDVRPGPPCFGPSRASPIARPQGVWAGRPPETAGATGRAAEI